MVGSACQLKSEAGCGSRRALTFSAEEMPSTNSFRVVFSVDVVVLTQPNRWVLRSFCASRMRALLRLAYSYEALAVTALMRARAASPKELKLPSSCCRAVGDGDSRHQRG